MKIAYLASSKLPSRTANSIHVMKMCQAFAVNGHEVTLYAQEGERCADIHSYYAVTENFTLKRLKYYRMRQLGNFLFSLKIRRLVMQERLPSMFYGRHLMSLLLAVDARCPICYEVHDVPSSRFNIWLERLLFAKKNFCLLVCISAALRDEYLRLYPQLLPHKIFVAHDGADDPGGVVITPSSSLNLLHGASGLHIGYVGHLYPGKGMEIISQMAALLSEEFFHVVGGTEHDIKYWQKNSPSNVVFHGFLPHSKLEPYYHCFDVVLAPLKRQISVAGGQGDVGRFTSPLKLFEYMAYGKPIICSDLPVLREFLSHDKNALLCSPDHIEDWLFAFKLLAEDQGLRTRLSINARRDFEKQYTWVARASRVLTKVAEETKVFDA